MSRFDFSAFMSWALPVARMMASSTATKLDDKLVDFVETAQKEGWFSSLAGSVANSITTGEEMQYSVGAEAEALALRMGVDFQKALQLVTLLVQIWFSDRSGKVANDQAQESSCQG